MKRRDFLKLFAAAPAVAIVGSASAKTETLAKLRTHVDNIKIMTHRTKKFPYHRDVIQSTPITKHDRDYEQMIGRMNRQGKSQPLFTSDKPLITAGKGTVSIKSKDGTWQELGTVTDFELPLK